MVLLQGTIKFRVAEGSGYFAMAHRFNGRFSGFASGDGWTQQKPYAVRSELICSIHKASGTLPFGGCAMHSETTVGLLKVTFLLPLYSRENNI